MGHEVPGDHGALVATPAVLGAGVCLPAGERRLLYTTDAIESLHMQLRKIVKTRGHFPSDEAATNVKVEQRGHQTECGRRPRPPCPRLLQRMLVGARGAVE